MPPQRIHRAQRVRGVVPLNRSERHVKGAGWHKRGYCAEGEMWINIKEGGYGEVPGFDINENATPVELVNDVASVQRRMEYYPERPGWTFDIFFRRKSLIEMLDEFREEGRAEEDDLVRDFFDGGETVYFKVYDSQGRERVYSGLGWGYHGR
ncbi:hypothetical protein GGR52DRAFT_576078 [Hypoxylon sp. FL1284]|nr:hypothetical protein GGR52DRAFT_576078 [Hypoxylon sp. FL1284]